MAKLVKTNHKITAIHKLYKIWMCDYLGFNRIKLLILREIKEDGVTFFSPANIDTEFTLIDVSDIASCFFELLNCPKYTDPAYFAILCEAFMDFSPLIMLDNVETYNLNPESKYCVGIIAGDYSSLIHGSKTDRRA